MNDKTMPAPAAMKPNGGVGQLQPDFKYIISTTPDNYILAEVYVVSKGRRLEWQDKKFVAKPDNEDTEYWWITPWKWPDLSTVGAIKIDVSPIDYDRKQDSPRAWDKIECPTFSCSVGDAKSWKTTPQKYDSADSYYYSRSFDSGVKIILQLVVKHIDSSPKECAGVQWWYGLSDEKGRIPFSGVLAFFLGTTLTKESREPDPSKYVMKVSY